MADGEPRWRRRKTARPGEIVAAAVEVFAERGFAAARLDDIAARAGVSKAALYLYFETKTDLFRAVAEQAVAPDIERFRPMIEGHPGPFSDLAPLILSRFAALAEGTRLGGIAKMVIGESRNFPELAQVWRRTVIERALGLLTGLIERAQARGEVKPGDPRFHAFCLLGPMMMGVLWREVMVPAGGEPIDLQQLAAQHADTLLTGLLTETRP